MSADMDGISPECRRWNERYAGESLFFGDQPSPFLVECLAALAAPGRALCLGEGEGRDALFLAARGWSVVAVDGAEVGLRKLQGGAAARGLAITTVCADLAAYTPETAAYGLVCSFFCHLTPELRRTVLRRVAAALAPDGVFVLEGFTVAQLLNQRTSGGPKDPALLYDPELLGAELGALFEEVTVDVLTAEIHHGNHHGPAELVRATARRWRRA